MCEDGGGRIGGGAWGGTTRGSYGIGGSPTRGLCDCERGRANGENEASSHCGRGCSVNGGGRRSGGSYANGESDGAGGGARARAEEPASGGSATSRGASV